MANTQTAEPLSRKQGVLAMARGKGSRSQDYKSINAWLKAQPRQDKRRLRDSLTRVQRLYRNRPEHGDFTWWHDVGSLVAKLAPKGGRYGENVMKLLAQHLEPDRKPAVPRYFLCKARDLADKFTREEASELTKARLKNGKPLTENHVKALVSVKDMEQRLRFFDKCLDQCWSVRRLRQEIQNTKGRKRSGAGRKPKRPEDPKRPERQSAGVALQNIFLKSRDWIRNHEVWFEEPSSPFRDIREEDCDEDLLEAFLEESRSAIEGLEHVHEKTGDGLKQLKSFVRELKKKLSA